MKIYLKLLFTSLAVIFCNQPTCQAESITPWQLPLVVNDNNTVVGFEIDTTWHIVYGKIKGTTGSIALSNPNEPLSVVSEFHFPTANFETGWSKRDDSLHEHMKVEQFPEVVFKTTAAQGTCGPDQIAQGPCNVTLVGTLTICDVTKSISVDATIEKKGDTFEVKGAYEFQWAEYNVDDPSIIIAKVDPTVKVTFAVTLPATSAE